MTILVTGGTGTINFQPSGQVGTQACFDLKLSGSNEKRHIDIQATGRAIADDGEC